MQTRLLMAEQKRFMQLLLWFYGPLLVGTWHLERIGERQRFFERLTFESDGTLTGLRKWQKRNLVTVDGKETLTDWENIPEEADGEHQSSGTFIGTWKLYWERNDGIRQFGIRKLHKKLVI